MNNDHDTIKQAIQIIREAGRISDGVAFISGGHEEEGRENVSWGTSDLLSPALGLLAKSQADLLQAEQVEAAIIEFLRVSAELGHIAENLIALYLEYPRSDNAKENLIMSIQHHVEQAHLRLRKFEESLK